MKSRLLKQLFRGYRKISYRMEKLREVHDIQRQVPPRALQAGVYVWHPKKRGPQIASDSPNLTFTSPFAFFSYALNGAYVSSSTANIN